MSLPTLKYLPLALAAVLLPLAGCNKDDESETPATELPPTGNPGAELSCAYLPYQVGDYLELDYRDEYGIEFNLGGTFRVAELAGETYLTTTDSVDVDGEGESYLRCEGEEIIQVYDHSSKPKTGVSYDRQVMLRKPIALGATWEIYGERRFEDVAGGVSRFWRDAEIVALDVPVTSFGVEYKAVKVEEKSQNVSVYDGDTLKLSSLVHRYWTPEEGPVLTVTFSTVTEENPQFAMDTVSVIENRIR